MRRARPRPSPAVTDGARRHGAGLGLDVDRDAIRAGRGPDQERRHVSAGPGADLVGDRAQRDPEQRRVGDDHLHRGIELERDLRRAQLGEQVLEIDALAPDLAAAEAEQRAAVLERVRERRREPQVLLLEPGRRVRAVADLAEAVAQLLERAHDAFEARAARRCP